MMELFITHSIKAGAAQDAWLFLTQAMGGFVNLGLNRAEFNRGNRICGHFVNEALPATACVATHLGAYESAFWFEWACYLKELSQIEAAEVCLSRAEGLSRGPIFRNDFIRARIELLLLRGKINDVVKLLERENGAALADVESDPDAYTRGMLETSLARALGLTGRVPEALQKFAARRASADQPYTNLFDHGRLHEVHLLLSTGMREEAITLVNEIAEMLYSPDPTWSKTLMPSWDLCIAEFLVGSGKPSDFERAEKFVSRAKRFAEVHDSPSLLCRSAIAYANLVLARTLRVAHSEGSADARPILDAIGELTDALTIARAGGLGLEVIDILLSRAQLALLMGWSADAWRDAQTAVRDGFDADPMMDWPSVLPATHPQCRNLWAEAQGMQIIAEASLLDMAQMLGSRSLTDVTSSDALEEARPAIDLARQQLEGVRNLRVSLNDVRLKRTLEVLEALTGHHLTDYLLTPVTIGTVQGPDAAQHENDDAFDVFISYRSSESRAARWIAKSLRSRGWRVWLDERVIRAGSSWQTALTRILETVPAALVLLGDKGLGNWQETEVQKLLIEQKRRPLSVIPLSLPGGPAAGQFPGFLATLHGIDVSAGLNDESAERISDALRAATA